MCERVCEGYESQLTRVQEQMVLEMDEKETLHCESLDAAVQQTCHIHHVVTQIGDGWHMTYKQQNVTQVALLISLSRPPLSLPPSILTQIGGRYFIVEQCVTLCIPVKDCVTILFSELILQRM